MARFMNHCCEPNAYARVISAPGPGLDSPDEKHIIIIAARDIQVTFPLTVGLMAICFPSAYVLPPCFF
jgi:SET domain-containing protein